MSGPRWRGTSSEMESGHGRESEMRAARKRGKEGQRGEEEKKPSSFCPLGKPMTATKVSYFSSPSSRRGSTARLSAQKRERPLSMSLGRRRLQVLGNSSIGLPRSILVPSTDFHCERLLLGFGDQLSAALLCYTNEEQVAIKGGIPSSEAPFTNLIVLSLLPLRTLQSPNAGSTTNHEVHHPLPPGFVPLWRYRLR